MADLFAKVATLTKPRQVEEMGCYPFFIPIESEALKSGSGGKISWEETLGRGTFGKEFNRKICTRRRRF